MFENWPLLGFSIASCFVMGTGILIFKPIPQRGWLFILVAQLFVTSGHLLYFLSKQIDPITNYGILSAFCYITGNAFFLFGMKELIQKYDNFLSKSTKLSGIILSLSLWIVLWVLRIQTDLNIPKNIFISTIIAIFLIELILNLISLSVLIMTKAGKTITFILIFSAGLFYCLAITNFFPNLGEPFDTFTVENLWMISKANLFFSIASFLLGFAFIHPSIKNLPEFTDFIDGENLPQMINILGISFMMIPASFLLRYLSGKEINFVFMLIMGALVFVLVFLQIKQLIHDYNEVNSLNLTLNDKNKTLNKLANTDHLTQLMNCNFLYEYLPVSLKKAELTNQKIAIILLDLDDFKIINDKHGHIQGDIPLKLFAEKINQLKRKGDYCIRFGGDEFLLDFRRFTR